jgi:hypothetical protein
VFDDDDEEEAADLSTRVFPQRIDTSEYMHYTADQREAVLDAIVLALRRRCSMEGTSPGDETSLFIPTSSNDYENAVRPGTEEGSWFAGVNSVSGFFLDSFLYSHAVQLEMIDRGEIDVFYCKRCMRTLQGETRQKKQLLIDIEEKERNEALKEIRARYRRERRERKEQRKIAARGDQPTGASSAVSAPQKPPPPSSSFFSSALSSLVNSFAFLTPTEDAEDEDEDAGSDPAAPMLTAEEQATEAAADAARDAELAAVPRCATYKFPRHDLQPSRCYLCGAPVSEVAIRTHLTHSISLKQLVEMHGELIAPNVDFKQPIGSASGKKAVAIPKPSSIPDLPYAVDIGSRLGNQLFAGLLHCPSCPVWIGVEMNGFFVEQSRRIVREWGVTKQISVIEDDVVHQQPLLRHAKLVVFFNPFELHVTREKHRELLKYFRASVCQMAQYILSCPSLEDIYKRAESDVDVEEWVELVVCKEDAFLYRVK